MTDRITLTSYGICAGNNKKINTKIYTTLAILGEMSTSCETSSCRNYQREFATDTKMKAKSRTPTHILGSC